MALGRLMSLLATLAAGGALGLVAVLAILWLGQSAMVYLPARSLDAEPGTVGLAYQDVHIPTADGLLLHGWLVPAHDARATLLFCHGNAGNISHRLESLALFHALGLSTLIFDYRGYGESPGRPSEAGTYLDARGAWDYLTRRRGVPEHQIVIFGRSLGAAVASRLASEVRSRGLILESAFSSAPALAADLYRPLPVRWLVRFRYDNLAHLSRVRAPVLVIHSRDDEIVPFRHGQAVHAAAPEPKTFVSIRGGHNDGFLISRRVYLDALARFLRSLAR